MSGRKKDRRRSIRKQEDGMALLVPTNSTVHRVAGVLIDTNHRGFRAWHRYSEFQQNDTVSFIHRLREGTARVIWTRAVNQEFETGFEYLDPGPGRITSPRD